MKETLRQQVEQMLRDLIGRQNMLDKNVKEYVEAGQLGDAAINQIKRDTIILVVSRLEKILK
jgi:hypothetical protein